MAKKRLTVQQEFEIAKLVLDKFLWLGFGIMALGMYKIFEGPSFIDGIGFITLGALVLVLFIIIVVKEYEFIAEETVYNAKQKRN